MRLIRFFFNLLIEPGPRYAWKKVLFLIILSFLPILSSFTFSFLFSLYVQYFKNPLKISVIAQTSPNYQALPTFFFAETLGLSIDSPLTFEEFDEEEGVERLLATHIIQNAAIRKLKPDTLYIDYTIRKPTATIGNVTNTLLSKDGYLIPSTPFYTPKNLTEIYIEDLPSQPWGKKLDERTLACMDAIKNLLKDEKIIRIDLSKMNAESSGEREIIVILNQKTLRLTPKNFEEEILNYLVVRNALLEDEKDPFILDLRIPKVAYFKKVNLSDSKYK